MSRSSLETPTVTLTLAGAALTGLYFAGQSWALWPAFGCLALPGIGGTAITLHSYVVRAAEEWTWRGIVRAFRKQPTDRDLWHGLLSHLPQAIAAMLLLVIGRQRKKE